MEKLKSRKLIVAVVSAALVALGQQIGLDHDSAQNLVTVVLGYLLAQGAHDVASARSASK
jgi:hypothetical protein